MNTCPEESRFFQWLRIRIRRSGLMEKVQFFFPLTLKPHPLSSNQPSHISTAIFFRNVQSGRRHRSLALLFRTNFPQQSWRTAAVSGAQIHLWTHTGGPKEICRHIHNVVRCLLRQWSICWSDHNICFRPLLCQMSFSDESLNPSQHLNIVFPFQGVSWDWDCT